MILRTLTRYDMDGTTIQEYSATAETLTATLRRALHDLNYRPSDETVQRIKDQLRRTGRSAYALTLITLEES